MNSNGFIFIVVSHEMGTSRCLLNGKENVFFITNNALKTAAYKLYLLLRKRVKDVGWCKFTGVVDNFRILKAYEIRRNLITAS